MNLRFTILIMPLLMTQIILSQKEELKEIKTALKDGPETAKEVIDKHTPLFTSDEIDKKSKEKYHNYKQNVYLELSKKDLSNEEIVSETIAILNNNKNSNDKINELATLLSDFANDAYNKKSYKEALYGFEKVYRLLPKDTIFLYSAALVAASSLDTYESAAKLYEELIALNYNGKETIYKARNIETGEIETLDKASRDLYVNNLKTHNEPTDEIIESRRPEIMTNLGKIYAQLNKNELALEYLKKARELNPKDTSLIIVQANILHNMGEKEKFKTLMQTAVELRPNDPDILYNIGVINSELKQYDEAIKNYTKVLELKPDYTNAAINLSATYLKKGNEFIPKLDQLNRNQKWDEYDKLNKKKDDLYNKAVDLLEYFLKTNNSQDRSILEQLKLIYGGLSNTTEYKRIKALLGEE